MKRRKAREHALQVLYQVELTGRTQDDMHLKSPLPDKKLQGFAEELVRGTLDNLEEIDSAIQKAAEHWKVGRMSAVDRNILRFAVYEIIHRTDIPPAVSINEALEIAKRYSSSESASFINGLLDRIAHNYGRA